MKKNALVVLIISLALLLGCTTEEDAEKVPVTSPFIGGTSGISADFVDLRADVFDGGRDPFDLIIKLDNLGEARVAKEDVRVKLSGFNPTEFGKTEADLVKSPTDNLLEQFKDTQGNVMPGSSVYVEFKELSHAAPITGSRVDLPIRADICYMYSTKAISKLCIRSDVLSPTPGGICEITEDKPVFNSGAPVQFVNFKEMTRARGKVGFSFEIQNLGQGDLFEMGSICDRSNRGYENKVYVKVNTNMEGLSCTGLETAGKQAAGFVNLFDKTKVITCTQDVVTGTDFEQVIDLEAAYDYEEFKQVQITVKSSGQ